MKSLARLHACMVAEGGSGYRELLKIMSTMSERESRSLPVCLLHPWVWPTRAWQRLHIDFAGPFMGRTFLLVVDAHSKWLEVIPMTSTTSADTIQVLRKLFASYGLPIQFISDNGPQFVSAEFEEFMKLNGIKHITSAAYHPSSNGQVERAVQTFKATGVEPGSLSLKLSRFCYYRTTRHTTTGLTPSQLFLRREVRTKLSLLKPNLSETVGHDSQSRLKTKRILHVSS